MEVKLSAIGGAGKSDKTDVSVAGFPRLPLAAKLSESIRFFRLSLKTSTSVHLCLNVECL